MEYSIQECSQLAGVTTRTLRWYDKINLLKPSRTAESGYRYYGLAEVNRLQNLLFYYVLGVELAQIKECLDSLSFDRLTALRTHLTALESEQTWLKHLNPLKQKKGMSLYVMKRNLKPLSEILWNRVRTIMERKRVFCMVMSK